jgi:FKBP-type peptidyl-prolyl cis-trans isomerase
VARPHQRVLAFILAGLFLLTSVGAGIGVIIQIKKDNDATAKQETAGQSNTTPTTQAPKEGTTLQGTKLTGFTPVTKVDKLQSTDLQVGTGEEVKSGATVTAHYTGALAKDGTIFQSSHDLGEAIEFSLEGVIKGWTDGVPGMKVGGKRRLVIPYALAYGEEGRPDGGIPAKADLVFDIELTAVKNP